MTIRNSALIVILAASSLAVSACAAEPVSAEAPETTLDSLDVADEGSTYNGWYQYAGGVYSTLTGTVTFHHGLTRFSGDTSRGGGACLVVETANTCSVDSDCLAGAQLFYGSSAYGYCYTGVCYSRPGSQATHCALNPNRSAAAGNMLLTKPEYYADDRPYHAVACMTKTAGPNTACGGTNTSNYMRVMHYLDYVTSDPCGGNWCGNECC
jgi:hypothetical protein